MRPNGSASEPPTSATIHGHCEKNDPSPRVINSSDVRADGSPGAETETVYRPETSISIRARLTYSTSLIVTVSRIPPVRRSTGRGPSTVMRSGPTTIGAGTRW